MSPWSRDYLCREYAGSCQAPAMIEVTSFYLFKVRDTPPSRNAVQANRKITVSVLN